MKKIGNLCFILLFAITAIFCVTACDSTPNDDGVQEEPSDTKISYEITVDTNGVAVDANEISVCVYSLSGDLVGEKKLSHGKTLFELDGDSYVATLSGLSDKVSYSSVLLTDNAKKGTIVLEKARYDAYREVNSFAFTVIVMAGDRSIDDLDVQFCDEQSCKPVWFEDGNIADIFLSRGEYEVKVYWYTGEDLEELYHDNYTLNPDKRFFVIVM